ncbi:MULTISPECIES: PilW family protein [unclassified Ectothiorhodospira]|uniref:PilW family protein n=1 Tax=unclassified Ectothiorhodospira TaxID=2684909 RepID=UPI001EE8C903|nr:MULTISPECIES: prepilin-type N-terminal cleavage/methylation domain-containing protein [unclassified Ectothiorhodospira]MCG5515317.1 prepilin-type N-terminal cleavage/methylation domain-containing protein [Ectothiorhodospira sp. 9100]MCG5519402.1 prepilin-type N-terminal cleavage/methylation domain-containing protein [Ectothiorhodospira sp. 9905]
MSAAHRPAESWPGVRGFSLVELMVAMVIGLILMAGVVQVFLANHTAYREAQRFSQLQETMAFAVDYLARDIRGAEHVTHADGELEVVRDRVIDWCGAPPGLHAVTYFIQNDALRCRHGSLHNHELLRGFQPGSELMADLLPDAADPVAVRLGLMLQSGVGQGVPLREHDLEFHVALRNRILAPGTSP